MSYEHKSNIGRSRISSTIKITISIAIVLISVNYFFPKFLSNVITGIVSPLWPNKNDVKISTELEDAIITQLEKENKELKSILNRKTESKKILANILKKPPYSAYDIYIIDVGTKQDISVGDRVYAVGGVLLGEIYEINNSTSKVKLYSSFGQKYDVLIGDNIEAVATGKGGGSFEISLPRDTKVIEGSIVSVPDIEIKVLGIVRKLIIDPAKTFYTVMFSQPVNIYEQRIVFIEK